VEARYEAIKLGPRALYCPAHRRLPARRFLVHCAISTEIREWHPHAFDDCNWTEAEAVREDTQKAAEALNFDGLETYTFLGHRTFFLDFKDAVNAAKRVFVELLAMLMQGDENTRLAEHCEVDAMLRVPDVPEDAKQRAADVAGGDDGVAATDVVVFREEVPLELDVYGSGCPNTCIGRLDVAVKSFTLASEEGLRGRLQCIECGAFAANKDTASRCGWDDDFLCPPCSKRTDCGAYEDSPFEVSSISAFGLRELQREADDDMLA